MKRHFIALLVLFASLPASAREVVFLGSFETKAAILSIASGAPRTVKVGQTVAGVTLVAVERTRATVDVDGERRVLTRNDAYSTTGSAASERQAVTLKVGFGGHFAADGSVNGGPLRLLVDTGATLVTLPGADAERLRIDYRKSLPGTVKTAGGTTLAYRVTLDSVRIGGIELNNVDALVIENGLEVALLGMTFLSRVDMKQDGGQLTMTRRY